MERSSRFISLSGVSGVAAGIYALIGFFVAYWQLNLDDLNYNPEILNIREEIFLLIDVLIVLVLAVGTAILLTTRKAVKDGNSIFDSTAKKLVLNLCIPLATGGFFCLAIFLHGDGFYVPSVMLIFYGLSLVHASNYTRNVIRGLGYAEIILGLMSLFSLWNPFLFWALGFGILHIVYGTYMYFKYER
jgi:hypothetical protein